MTVTVRIPGALRSYTAGEGSVAVSATTVGEALGQVAERYPDLRPHLYDDEGELRNFVNAYLNEDDVRGKEGVETPVSDGDTVVIVPSIAGGRAEVAGGRAG